jgi:pyruvate dehydrogenase E1 component
VQDGIIRGMYKFNSKDAGGKLKVNLFGSGAILRHVLKAQDLLAEKYGIGSNVWSVTSYTQLRRDAHSCEHWNMLHPDQPRRVSYVEELLKDEKGSLFVAASDYVRAVQEQIAPWVPGDFYALGTDGMGRSETREVLRRHFEVDAECITLATLYRLGCRGDLDMSVATHAIKDLGINPEKVDPYFA